MDNALATLLGGELQRMRRYHILTASLLVSLLWIGMIHLLDVGDIDFIFGMIIFFDLVSMPIVMIGVTIFYEKQEGVLKSLFVSPVTRSEFIASKVLGNLLSNLITILLIYLYGIAFRDIAVSLPGLLAAVVLIGTFHSLVGFLLIYNSRGFTELLIGMVKYFLVFMIPVVLEQFGVITGDLYSRLLYLLPTKSSATLIEAVTVSAETGEVLLSSIYLIAGSLLLAYFVFRGFKDFTIRESGV